MPRTFLASSLSLLTLVAAGSALAAGSAELTDTTRDSGRPMAPEQAAVVFEHADLSFKLIPADKRLEGDATLRLRATSPLSALVVDLDRNYAVGRVEVDGRAIAPGDWSNPEGRMRIALPRPLAAGKAVTLRIVYAGSPHEAKKAPWDGGIVWATAPTGEPWVATAVEGEGCDLLWPCIDHPKGEPAQVDEHITVPAPLVAPGNGVLVGMREHAGWRTYHWRARQPDTYAVTLNAGPFEQLQADYRSRYGNVIPLAFWYLKGHREKAEKLFAEFPKMLDFFEGVIGPYPFGDEKMGVVETPHLGMEHQTINAYGNGYKRDKYGYDWLLQHEFSHEWFGNQLTNADWDDMWLHEGFGSYMQPLYLQYLRGQMDYHAALLDQRAGVANKVPMVSGHTMTEEGVYNADNGPGNDIYYKGSYMLHMLRGLIGDEAFFRSIRELVYGTDAPRPGNFRPRYAGTQDYVDIVGRVTGKDYGWFFDAYLRHAALPQLLAERDATGLALHWQVPGDGAFPVPVDVRIGGNAGHTVTVPMRDGRGHVDLPAGALYTLDPDSKLLREEPRFAEAREDAAQRRKAVEAAAKKTAPAAGG